MCASPTSRPDAPWKGLYAVVRKQRRHDRIGDAYLVLELSDATADRRPGCGATPSGSTATSTRATAWRAVGRGASLRDQIQSRHPPSRQGRRGAHRVVRARDATRPGRTRWRTRFPSSRSCTTRSCERWWRQCGAGRSEPTCSLAGNRCRSSRAPRRARGAHDRSGGDLRHRRRTGTSASNRGVVARRCTAARHRSRPRAARPTPTWKPTTDPRSSGTCSSVTNCWSRPPHGPGSDTDAAAWWPKLRARREHAPRPRRAVPHPAKPWARQRQRARRPLAQRDR